MAGTISVPYYVAAGEAAEDAINESWSRTEGPTARVRMRCDWTDRYQFVRDLMGAGGFSPPFAYPLSPNMYCIDIESIRPIGGMTEYDSVADSPWPAYQKAEVVAMFGVPKYNWDGTTGDISGQPWITTTFDLSAENYTIPDTAFYWEGTADPVNGATLNLIIAQVGIRFQRQWAPLAAVTRALDYIGTVNDSTFTLGDLECEPETLLFLGGPSERALDTLLNWKHDLTYNLAYRRTGWNTYYNPKPGEGWQNINAVSSGTNPADRIYEQTNFMDLFEF